ncbi:methyltransferase-like 26 [Macrosteles quadrilineatus]|uniref:methyltransferase-like 26 n=1 Tax=Macrosteles quadrilineatus TaxID=74068 RepID=UPI0023E0D0B5|nr:methyltransferase-like 26 [Macrosteles quadrilineatus]
MTSERPLGAVIYPAAERNKSFILQCLQQYITLQSGFGVGGQPPMFLEVASGTGQHISHFAPHFPHVTFQPTEYDLGLLSSIDAFRNHLKISNMKKAARLDVTTSPDTWLDGGISQSSVDYMYNANMIHISPWACTEGLFKGASYILKPGGYLFMYGPFAVDSKITPESNVSFDRSLRSQNEEWGLRDLTRELEPLASGLGLTLVRSHDLPANNKFLAWMKQRFFYFVKRI